MRLKKRFKEAVSIFFEELVKKGTLDEVLESLGWQKIKSDGRHPISFLKNRKCFSSRRVDFMSKLKPISWRKFESFLFYVGCHYERKKGRP